MTKQRYNLYDGEHPLFFEKRRHIYTNNHGEQVANATGVLKMLSKPNLAPWYARMAAEGFAKQMEAGESYDEIQIMQMEKLAKEAAGSYSGGRMDVGTVAHDWMEDFINYQIREHKGPAPKPFDDIVNPNVRRSVGGFLDWNIKYNPTYLEAERPVYSVDDEYCGKIDAVCEIDDALMIVDFKTGKGVWPEAGLQAAAYTAAYVEEHPACKERAERLILHLPAFEGKPKVWTEEKIEKQLTGYGWERDSEVFLSLLDAYYWAWNGPNRWTWFGKKRA